MFHIHKRQKRIMDADEWTFRAQEPVDDQKCGFPLTQYYGVSLKVMHDLPLTPK